MADIDDQLLTGDLERRLTAWVDSRARRRISWADIATLREFVSEAVELGRRNPRAADTHTAGLGGSDGE